MLLYHHGISRTPVTLVGTESIPYWSAIPAAYARRPPLFHLLHRRRSLFASASPDSDGSGKARVSAVDRAAYEAERLRLDAASRESMAATANASEESDDSVSWKWRIRKRIWDLMESENIARNPRPVHHRIPNFVGAPRAAESLGRLEVFEKAQCVKVNPDSPQKQVRFLTLAVHDKQLVDDIPVEKLLIHDVPVDIICTPTQVIYTNTAIPKPEGIYWEKLSPEKLGQIRVLRELKKRIEKETGQMLPSAPSQKLPPTAQRRNPT
ncbi:hypothetical protein KSP39_PZI014589 [Platanthera zijinensis]|uniref:Uncharacterized protein n=1 Tax=Platanthera zijinensis TaxID=2320716 RepID=A0AAP0B9J7_9ASPA